MAAELELLTVDETARILKVSPISVRRYIASGRLAAVKVGRAVRIRKEAIEAFLTPIEPSCVEGGPDPDGHGLWTMVDVKEDKPLPEDYIEGKPLTREDSLFKIVSIAGSDDEDKTPTDVSSNKYEYLAEAYYPSQE